MGAGSTARRSTSMVSPPRMRYPALSRRPSMLIAPDLFNSWICDRVRVSTCRERKMSRRRPRSSGPAWSFTSQDLQSQQNDADRNRRIGNVEGWPVVRADVELEEVHNVSIGQSVVQIAQRSAENERQRNLQQTVSPRASDTVSDDDSSRTGGKKCKKDGPRRPAQPHDTPEA